MYAVKRYTVAQVRDRLASALDEAASGVPVLIERRGVRFRLTVEPRPARARRARRGIVAVDPAVDAGQWRWTWSPKGLAFKARRPGR
jgi:antitoxin (DNA-binding transcriptional repressor) of toxin-antitoxin stability system